MMLEQTVRSLAPGGRLAVITHHSLEDLPVKNLCATTSGKVEKDFYGRVAERANFRGRYKAVVPTPEIEHNPRSQDNWGRS